MCVYIYACMNMYIYIYTCVYYVYIYILCVYIYYVCIYKCIYIYLSVYIYIYCTSPKNICAMGSSTVHFQSLGVLNPSSKGLKQPMMSRFQSWDGWTNPYIYVYGHVQDNSPKIWEYVWTSHSSSTSGWFHTYIYILYIWYQFSN